jgi:hypothetical protein
MFSLVTLTTAVAIAIGTSATPLTASAVLDSPHRHVRTTDHALQGLLRRGFQGSATFAGLLRRLELSDLTVYIEAVPRLPGSLEGRLIMLPPAHGYRYVRIQVVRRGNPWETIALIGHELRHAVEVAGALEVTDDRSLADFYRRIGTTEGKDVFDTIAARETGRRVLRELAA